MPLGLTCDGRKNKWSVEMIQEGDDLRMKVEHIQSHCGGLVLLPALTDDYIPACTKAAK